jgi:hypothetical protein
MIPRLVFGVIEKIWQMYPLMFGNFAQRDTLLMVHVRATSSYDFR